MGYGSSKGGGAVEGGLLLHWVWNGFRSDNSKYYVNLHPVSLLGRLEPKHGLADHSEFMRCIMNYEGLPIGIDDASYSWWLRFSSFPIVQGREEILKTWYPAGLLP
jgi:hypothetical protein